MSQPGYVYIVSGRGTSYIKVGKTTQLAKRLRNLSHGVPFALDLLYAALVHDMDKEERFFKHKFQEFQSRGEWFQVPENILSQWPLAALPFDGPREDLRIQKYDKPRTSFSERVLILLQERGCLTVRDLCRSLYKATSHDVHSVLEDLLHNEVIRIVQIGKTTSYAHMVPALLQLNDSQELL